MGCEAALEGCGGLAGLVGVPRPSTTITTTGVCYGRQHQGSRLRLQGERLKINLSARCWEFSEPGRNWDPDRGGAGTISPQEQAERQVKANR